MKTSEKPCHDFEETINVYSHCPRGKVVTILLAVLLLLVGALNAKADECKKVPTIFGFRPGETTEGTFYTSKNTPCVINFTVSPYAYFKQRVTKRPHGFYGISSLIHGAYQPPKDYVGDDYFELLLDYQKLGVGQERHQSILKITVKIAE